MTPTQPGHSPVQDLLRKLPKVDRLLDHPDTANLLERFPRQEIVAALRDTLDHIRKDLECLLSRPDESGGVKSASFDDSAVLSAVGRRLEDRGRSAYRRVINGSGVVLHTGLGRAVLSESARDALAEALAGYSVVEVDARSGERNRREGQVVEMLCELTGAEAGTVVNNNAAATLIILAALARGTEVIISRGQLVEIGGSYRIPTILEESGASLVEVGTTNRTYIEDYRRAVGDETGLLLSVHTSNYEIAGFSHHTPLEELVALGSEVGVPVVSDLGSGCFVDLAPYGFRKEPLVTDSIRAGADLVCFSGDKLLGGPQAGIILGRADLVEEIRSHALFRAMRVDKMTLIALEATLRLYRDPERLVETLPVLRMLSVSEKDLRKRGERFRRALQRKTKHVRVELVKEASQTGSGSLPAQDLPTCAAALSIEGMAPDALADKLRSHEPPILTRIQNDRVLVDFRTLFENEEKIVIDALGAL